MSPGAWWAGRGAGAQLLVHMCRAHSRPGRPSSSADQWAGPLTRGKVAPMLVLNSVLVGLNVLEGLGGSGSQEGKPRETVFKKQDSWFRLGLALRRE